MKRLETIFLLAFLCAVATRAGAQDTVKLSLEQAVEIALSDNPTIQIAGKEIERQEYVRKETVGNLWPNLSASGAYNYNVIKTSFDMGNGQKMSLEPDNTLLGAANLSLPLYVPAVYRTMQLNDEQMRAAVESARASRVTLVSEVKKAFYNILLAEESLKVLRGSEANINQTLEQTQVMFSNGLASEYDLLTAQVQSGNLRPAILQAENGIKSAKQQLLMYLYLPLDTPIEITGDLSQLKEQVAASESMGAPDLAGNTDIRQLEIQTAILQQQLRVARTSRMPSLAAVSSFQVMGRDKVSFSFGGDDGSSSAKKTFEWFTPMTAGAQLSVPIFAGNTNRNRERQIKKSIEQLQLQTEYAVEGVSVQAATALYDIATAREQMIANETTIKQAQKAYDITKTRYLAGSGTILEVNAAELALTQASLNLSQAVYNFLSAEAEYQRILGSEK